MIPTEFKLATIHTLANTYFDGKVVSHTLITSDGEKKTLGVILPGEYRFDTGAPERMDIVAGSCEVKVADAAEWQTVEADAGFDVAGDSFFVIKVAEQCQYLCSFLSS